MNKNNRESAQIRPFYLADWYVEPASDCIRDKEQQRKLESKVMAVLAYLPSRLSPTRDGSVRGQHLNIC